MLQERWFTLCWHSRSLKHRHLLGCCLQRRTLHSSFSLQDVRLVTPVHTSTLPQAGQQ